MTQEDIKAHIKIALDNADSGLDRWHLWKASLPTPWTFVVDVITAAAIFTLGYVVHGLFR